jgi:hypothetical protein
MEVNMKGNGRTTRNTAEAYTPLTMGTCMKGSIEREGSMVKVNSYKNV